MQLKPRKLTLHPAPRKAIERAVGILSKWVDLEKLRLGGGTTLEARWHHRASTDLDFFISGSEADELFYYSWEKMQSDLAQLARDDVINPGIRATGREVIHFSISDTPISLARVPLFHGDPCDEIENKTGVILNGTKDILTKKLQSRVAGNQVFLERDAYDFAVARTEAPEDLAYAWEIIQPAQKASLLEMYQYLSTQTPSAIRDAQYIDIGSDVWLHVYRLFDSDLAYLPPMSRTSD